MKCQCEGCDKALPKERKYNQRFCSQKCYVKQNKVDIQKKNRAKREKLKPVKAVCRLITCGKEFDITGKRAHKKYCTDECKRVATRLRGQASRLKAGAKPRVPKEKTPVVIKEPKCTINPIYLHPRGSKKRKEMGLEDTVYNQNRGYSVEMGA